jgi:ribose 5-phosphate isomerase B
MKIVIASDHAGFELKKYFIESLPEIVDMGAFTYDENDDYPDYIKKVGEYISENFNSKEYRGIVIGGSGQGESICADKFVNVRSTLIYGDDMELNTQIAKLGREHNDANVISFGARFIINENALFIFKIWLNEPFSKEERHIRRLNKIEK